MLAGAEVGEMVRVEVEVLAQVTELIWAVAIVDLLAELLELNVHADV